MNTNIESTIIQSATCLEYQQTQAHGKTIPCEIPGKPWEVISANIFFAKNSKALCIVDCYIKFPIVKKTGSLAVDDLVKTANMIFAEYGLPKK